MKVLKFGALWCPGCLIMKPRWNEVEESNLWLETEYYDYDENRELAKSYNITSVLPVFIFLDKNNNEIYRMNGEPSKKEILEAIEKYKNN